MTSLRALSYLLVGGLAAAGAIGLVAVGCSFGGVNQEGVGPPFDEGVPDDAQVFEVGDEIGPVGAALCGVPHCDPDREDICVPRVGDADVDADAPSDATDAEVGSADAPGDSAPNDAGPVDAASDVPGSGTRNACRVGRDDSGVSSLCALAGDGIDEAFCTRDADCAPGYACVGNAPARCLHYCCSGTPDNDPCHADHRYCTPLPSAERPSDLVPVCVTPDECTLLQDDTSCQSSTTCTVVTKYGDTSCVPFGTARDGQSCDATTLCDRGYMCVGVDGDRHCRKLCHVGADGECAAGTCERLPNIPTGFGLCLAVGDGGT